MTAYSEALENCLRELVRLKTLKEAIESGNYTGDTKREYEAGKEAAWAKARALLAGGTENGR